MATSAAIRAQGNMSAAPTAARLIPGVPFTPSDSPRKKSQSVSGPVSWAAKEATQNNERPGFLQTVGRAVFPLEAVRGREILAASYGVADFLVLSGAYAGACLLAEVWRTGPGAMAQVHGFPLPGGAGLFLYGALLAVLTHAASAQVPERPGMRDAWANLLSALLWATLLFFGAMRWSQMEQVSTAAFVCSVPLTYCGMLAWRSALWRHREKRSTRRRSDRNLLIIGAGIPGRAIAAHLKQHPEGGRVVCGFLDESRALGGDILGRISQMGVIARALFVDEVIVALPQHHELARRVVREARYNRLDVTLVPDLCGPDLAPLAFATLGNVPVLTLCQERGPLGPLLIKRAIDVVLGSAVLVGALPLMALVAAAIKLDSPGPLLYRSFRMGRKGKKFVFLKFRTMVDRADNLKTEMRTHNEREGAFFKIANDPRITMAGRFLRRHSLDEIPQLWNVLRGDMSLVGPRPHPLDDYERYGLEDLRRLDMTPGMTGLWQVTARRDPSFARNMALDREYIEHWSLWLDMQILCKTIPAVLDGSGS